MPGSLVELTSTDDVPAPAAKAAAGWFGKLSCLGDFSSRRLPHQFTQLCDDWLSSGIASSQEQLGDRWLDVYLTAPLWRFAWAPGVADQHWWLGAMMPSVDNTGRYFPLVVAKACKLPPTTPAALTQLEDWFDQVASSMLSTLQPDSSIDSFDAQLMALPNWPEDLDTAVSATQLSAAREQFEMPQGMGMNDCLPRMAAAHYLTLLRGQSLWWAVRDQGPPHALSVAYGLPPAERFVELLEATW